MAEENEAAKKDATELEESKLAEADGGFGISDLIGAGVPKRIHKGCGGIITDDPVACFFFSHSYVCTRCNEGHDKLEEFDYYIKGLGSPML